MKKVISLILVLCLFLCACDKDSDPSDMQDPQGLDYELGSEERFGKDEYLISGIGDCTDTDLVIPSTYKGKPVVGIDADAFSQNTSLTSVTIPDGITYIGAFAFSNCPALTSVTIPGSVEYIGYGAFQSCENLKEITFIGTKAQWDSAREGTDLAAVDVGVIIHCSDGDIKAGDYSDLQ